MNEQTQSKVRMINGSIRCLIFGLLALLPLVGLPFGLAALYISGGVRQQEKRFWNAAKPYRLIGVICGAIGAVLWAGILFFAFGNLLMSEFFGIR